MGLWASCLGESRPGARRWKKCQRRVAKTELGVEQMVDMDTTLEGGEVVLRLEMGMAALEIASRVDLEDITMRIFDLWLYRGDEAMIPWEKAEMMWFKNVASSCGQGVLREFVDIYNNKSRKRYFESFGEEIHDH